MAKEKKRIFFVILATIISLVFFTPSISYTENYYWIGDSGLWNDLTNWNPLGPPPLGSPIFPEDAAYLVQSDAINRTVTLNNHIDISRVVLDSTGTGSMTFSIQDGTIGGIGDLIVNNGTVNQSGGSFTPFRVVSVNNGVYNLSGGSIAGISSADAPLDVNGSSTFNQTGGLVRAIVDLSPNATYNLSAPGQIQILHNAYIYGVFNQTGGNVSVDSPYQFIIGGTYNLSNGALRISDVVNNGTINYSGGSFSLNVFGSGFPVHATLLNSNIVNLSGSGTRTIEGKIINNGTFKTTQTTAVYTVAFTNNGAYISDPATQYFNDLIVGQSGYLVGQHADKFFVSGDFISSSIMNMDWNTMHAYLEFIDGADNLHDFYLTGHDYGATMSGYANNFSWGTMDITDDNLTLYDGNTKAGAALYLRELWGAKITEDLIIANLIGFDGLDIYYMPHLKENWYLGWATYDLTGGGHLRPAGVPEPSTMLLLGSSLLGLVAYGRKPKKC